MRANNKKKQKKMSKDGMMEANSKIINMKAV